MSFWLREIVGWLLLALGVWLILICYTFLREGLVLEAGPMCIISLIVFRGGIHLLKVAVAARICREARDRTKIHKPTVKTPARPTRPVNPLPARGS